MPNRLAASTSPYLLQHQDNPVDWMEWGPEAFELASREDRPIFLSIGYSSCHWCHVMAHESFEDEEVARVLNSRFVSIKVDREERPDVDEAYMAAVQLATGRGGWPMSCFLTPDKKPFFAGTYFPKEDRGEYPGFLTLLLSIHHAWVTRRSELVGSANEFAEHLVDALSRSAPSLGLSLDDSLFESAIQVLHEEFDHEHGGFGSHPKFPPHTALSFMLDYALHGTGPIAYREMAREMSLATLHAMCLGGIHDHLGGGFHRYSTDERWLLPHFEKMLYDNAQLLECLQAASLLDDPRSSVLKSAATGIVSWLKQEMTSPEGCFYSAVDADSEGEEGRYYTWNSLEIDEVLGADSLGFKEVFQVKSGGNFDDEATRQPSGLNILHLQEPQAGFASEKARLLLARSKRIRPETDIKSLASWNGMMIRSLALVGEAEAASRCAETWLKAEREAGFLPHQITNGRSSGLAFLDDYAHLADGLFILSQATSDTTLKHESLRLTQKLIALFKDSAEGGFFFRSNEHEELFGRPKPPLDGSTPSPNSVAIRCLIHHDLWDHAEKALTAFLGWMTQAPNATESMLCEAMRFRRLSGR